MKKSPGRAQAAPMVNPDEESASMKPVVFVCVILFLGALLLRYSIFGLGYGPLVTAEDYDKPVRFERLVPAEGKGPSSFTRTSCDIAAAGDEAFERLCREASLPARRLGRIALCRFERGGREFKLVIAEFKDPAEAAKRGGAFLVQDGRGFYVLGEPGGWADELAEAAKAHAVEEKKLRVKIAKLRTAGNASFCFFMDLLVGAFFFVLALFLAKYFLIVRQVEK